MLERILPTPPDITGSDVPVFRKNVRMHLLDGSFYVFGMSMVSQQTILPVLIKELGGSSVSIGSVQMLWTLGQNLPSMFVAHYLHRRVLFSGPMVFWGLIHRIMLLIAGVLAFFLVGKVSPSVAVPLFLLIVFLIPAIGSLSGLPWFQVYTKTVPVKVRGRLMAVRQLLGSAAGAVGGTIISIVLATIMFPSNFSVLFVLGFLFTMVSFVFLARITEPPSVLDGKDTVRPPLVAEAKRVLKENGNFRNYLLADLFLLMSLTVSSFYAVHALEEFSLPASYAGTFTAIIMVSNIAANLVFGMMGDHYGHRVNLMVYAGMSFTASLAAVVSPNILAYGIVFICMACGAQIQAISRLSFIAELCREHERPVFLGIMNTVSAPTVFIGLVFGALIPTAGYTVIFLAAALLAVISFLILYRNVVEPRHRNA